MAEAQRALRQVELSCLTLPDSPSKTGVNALVLGRVGE